MGRLEKAFGSGGRSTDVNATRGQVQRACGGWASQGEEMGGSRLEDVDPIQGTAGNPVGLEWSEGEGGEIRMAGVGGCRSFLWGLVAQTWEVEPLEAFKQGVTGFSACLK